MTGAGTAFSIPEDLAATMPLKAVLMKTDALREMERVVMKKGQPAFNPAAFAIMMDNSSPGMGCFCLAMGLGMIYLLVTEPPSLKSDFLGAVLLVLMLLFVSAISFRSHWFVVAEPAQVRLITRGFFSRRQKPSNTASSPTWK